MNDEKNDGGKIICVEQLSLEEWLVLLFKPPRKAKFVHCQFPTDEHLNTYLETVHNRPYDDVTALLSKLLVPTGGLGADRSNLANLLAAAHNSPEEFMRRMKMQYYKRLWANAAKQSKIPPWEGITWILDLLPHFPKEALEGLHAYTLAHAQLLPDGRLQGLADAAAVIRAKYIEVSHSVPERLRCLLDQGDRSFECIIERLYHSMNYQTRLTPARKDGGRDIEAAQTHVGKVETLVIECKHYTRPVGVRVARELLGVVSCGKMNKGVIVTTSRFTKGAQQFARENPRLELIDGSSLVPLMNEHLGESWPWHSTD